MRVILWIGFLLSLAYAFYAGFTALRMGFVPFREAEATVFYLLVVGLPLIFGAAILRHRAR